jgi:hypothetical protein
VGGGAGCAPASVAGRRNAGMKFANTLVERTRYILRLTILSGKMIARQTNTKRQVKLIIVRKT